MAPRISEILTALKQRQRQILMTRLGLRGMFYGGALALVVVVLLMLSGQSGNDWRWQLGLSLPILGALTGIAAGLLAPLDHLSLARSLDRAAGSKDRFASAVQLAAHHRQDRVRLITADALVSVAEAKIPDALPMKYPRELKLFPVIVALFALSFLFDPAGNEVVASETPPEVSDEQWDELAAELKRRIEKRTKQEEIDRELDERLRKLAKLLAKHPDKRDVLAEVAKMRADLARQRKKLKTRDIRLDKSAKAIRSSEHLKKLAELLKSGDYRGGAKELRRLAKMLESDKLKATAEDLEKIAADFERLAKQLQPHEKLSKACENCASAANSLKQNQLAKSLQDLADQIEQCRDDMKKNESLCEASNALDDFERRLAQTKSDQQEEKKCSACQGKDSKNCSACQGGTKPGGGARQFVRRGGNGKKSGQRSRGGKKGGTHAGTQTAPNWFGGKLSNRQIGRLPTMVPDKEGDGPSTNVSQSISNNEKDASELQFKKKYAELVQKAEADLALEDIPIAYREFLKRYFQAIKPVETEEKETEEP